MSTNSQPLEVPTVAYPKEVHSCPNDGCAVPTSKVLYKDGDGAEFMEVLTHKVVPQGMQDGSEPQKEVNANLPVAASRSLLVYNVSDSEKTTPSMDVETEKGDHGGMWLWVYTPC